MFYICFLFRCLFPDHRRHLLVLLVFGVSISDSTICSNAAHVVSFLSHRHHYMKASCSVPFSIRPLTRYLALGCFL
ncbi:hypothetical protein B0T17DRAFT_519149, partial [Bombardia bombarda]